MAECFRDDRNRPAPPHHVGGAGSRNSGHALATSRGDIEGAMDLLGIPRRTLNEKMARYGLERQAFLPRSLLPR